MKFEDAFNAAFEKEKERAGKEHKSFAVTPATAKTLAFMWNMLALSDFVLDDLAAIDHNNSIVSIPLSGEKTKGQTSSTKKTAKKVEGGNDTSDKQQS